MLTSSSTRGAGTRPPRRGPATFESGARCAPHGSRSREPLAARTSSTPPSCSPTPGALLRFGDSDVVLPLVVIGELEDKRDHPELGWFARQSLRMLDDLRVTHGRLDAPVPVGEDGGTLHVELNHSDPAVLPAGFRNDSNDSRIMVVALNLRAEGRDVCLITKDVPLRVKAAAVGLDTDEYRVHDAVDAGWTGMAEVSLDDAELDELYESGEAFVPAAAELPPHTGLVLLSSRGSALGRVTAGQAGAAGPR